MILFISDWYFPEWLEVKTESTQARTPVTEIPYTVESSGAIGTRG